MIRHYDPMVLVRGYVRGGVHMLLILSPIVQSGGLIDDALAPHVIYRNRMLSICQDTKYVFNSEGRIRTSKTPAKESAGKQPAMFTVSSPQNECQLSADIRRCIPMPPPLLGKKSKERNSSSSFSTLSLPNNL
jgi:hypothetical protein